MLKSLRSTALKLMPATKAAGPTPPPDIAAAVDLLKERYRPEYERHWLDFERARVDALDPIAKALHSDGFVRFDSVLTPSQIAAAMAELNAIPGAATGDYSGPIAYAALKRDGIAAMEVTPDLPVCLDILMSKADFLQPVRALYGEAMQLSSRTASFKYGIGDQDSSNVPHWDHWEARIKAFLYLTDVTEDQAPTVYLRGTNKQTAPSFRFNKDFATKFLPGSSTGGSWVPFYGAESYEAVTFTAPAGSMFLFDARGVHAGSSLRGGRRIMLTTMFTHHPYSFRPY